MVADRMYAKMSGNYGILIGLRSYETHIVAI